MTLHMPLMIAFDERPSKSASDGDGLTMAGNNGASKPLGRLSKILLVDDDAELSAQLMQELQRLGLSVSHFCDRQSALAEMNVASFDLLILDRMLHGVDGVDMIRTFRCHNTSCPVLIISALDDIDERVFGLKSGADDYLIKPFAYPEFCARVETLLRRAPMQPQTNLIVGDMTLDLLNRVAILHDNQIDLSPREFELLRYFMLRPGQLVTKQMLLHDVWKYRFPVQTNVVDVHLSKLRQILESGNSTCVIKNVRSRGYVFDQDD
jgi:two-component system, OmpR family, response regulator